MVWNGNALTGQQPIAQFLESLPQSEHKLKSLDAQVIPSKQKFVTFYILLGTKWTNSSLGIDNVSQVYAKLRFCYFFIFSSISYSRSSDYFIECGWICAISRSPEMLHSNFHYHKYWRSKKIL